MTAYHEELLPDPLPPGPMELASATHTPGIWSTATVVEVAWQSAQDAGSGLGGYSVVWDRFAETLPDDTIDLGSDVVNAESEKISALFIPAGTDFMFPANRLCTERRTGSFSGTECC